MSKPFSEKVFDAVFSGLNRVDWHLDGWGGSWCAERLEIERIEQGILVGVKGDDITDIIWVGSADSREFKTQLRVEAHLETSFGTTKFGNERKIVTIKSCLPKLLENRSERDRVRIRGAIGEKILRYCKAFGSVELDLGLRGGVFFKARSLEELMLKVDIICNI